MNVSHENPDEVKREAVYGEVYNEMRRYRDYEFTSSTWFTALLLAVLGFLVATRYGETASRFESILARSCVLKFFVVLGAGVVATTSSYLVWYSSHRYQELRAWANDHLEPDWKKFKPRMISFTPRHIFYITPWLFAVLIAVVTFLPSTEPAKGKIAPDFQQTSTNR